MEALFADLHLTDNPKDDYRFGIFNRMETIVQHNEINEVFLLGDLTEKKDKHPAYLVNKITQGINALSKIVTITILKGNHDYIEADNPFFKFLDITPNVNYITTPCFHKGKGYLYLPHTYDPITEWESPLVKTWLKEAKIIFMHQPVAGAVSNNKFKIKSVLPSTFFNDFKAKVYSGDIHVPQTLGKIEYVGAPYHIYFGDNYTGRTILLPNKGKATSIDLVFLKKHSIKISSMEELIDYPSLVKDDQIKIEWQLHKADFDNVDTYKKQVKQFCQDNSLDLCGLSFNSKASSITEEKETDVKIEKMEDEDFLKFYCKKEGLSLEQYRYGKKIIEGANEDQSK